jgi:hypothetical protein
LPLAAHVEKQQEKSFVSSSWLVGLVQTLPVFPAQLRDCGQKLPAVLFAPVGHLVIPISQ